jgi:hypothetical protein
MLQKSIIKLNTPITDRGQINKEIGCILYIGAHIITCIRKLISALFAEEAQQ